MLKGKGVPNLPGHILAVYLHNILKLFTLVFKRAEESGDLDPVHRLASLIIEKLPNLAASCDLEVQERAMSALCLIKWVQKQLAKGETGLSEELSQLFVGELNPVAPKAQKKVQVLFSLKIFNPQFIFFKFFRFQKV